MPNQLCNYLYELSGLFMKFYENCPILKAEGSQAESRLALCRLTAETLQQGVGAAWDYTTGADVEIGQILNSIPVIMVSYHL